MVGILLSFLMISQLSIYMCLTPYPRFQSPQQRWYLNSTVIVPTWSDFSSGLLHILHRSWLVAITAPALQPRQARAILHSFGCSRSHYATRNNSRCSLSRYSPISFNPKREKPRSVFWKRERRSKLYQEMRGIAIQRIPTRIGRYV